MGVRMCCTFRVHPRQKKSLFPITKSNRFVSPYLLQHGVLLLGGQPEVPLLAGAELGRLLLKLLLPLLDFADLLAAEFLERLDELLVSALEL